MLRQVPSQRSSTELDECRLHRAGRPAAVQRRSAARELGHRAELRRRYPCPSMRSYRDPDIVLVDEMLAPPALDDARRSLQYWQRRLDTLPVYKRAARREAREMASRWHDRLRAAERARFESSLAGRLLAASGLPSLWPWWVRFRRRGPLLLAWDLVPRQAKLVAGTILAGWLLLSLAAATAVVVVLAQLA